MTQENQGDQGSLENFESRLEGGFEWLEKNRRTVGFGVIALLVVAGLVAAGVEWSNRQEAAGQMAIGEVDQRYLEAMGAAPGELEAPEPANARQATDAREAALAGYSEIATEHSSRTAGKFASLRAAEVEVALERYAAATERLTALVDAAGASSILGATANRLLGFAYEELKQPADAAKAYEAAGSAAAYPARETAWLAAAETYLRAGDNESAARAFQELKAVDEVYATALGVDSRLEALGVEAD